MEKKLAVFASGNGSNFEAIAKACADGSLDAKIVLCVTDKPGAYVTKRAEKYGVPVLEFTPKDFLSKADYEKMLVDRLMTEEVDLICLAGYMRIVGDTLLSAFDGRIINIHPALLPAFKGAHAIKDSFEYGVKVFGVTIHYVDPTIDGGKIISQAAVPYEGDDIDELESMIHAQEHILYPATIKKLLKSL